MVTVTFTHSILGVLSTHFCTEASPQTLVWVETVQTPPPNWTNRQASRWPNRARVRPTLFWQDSNPVSLKMQIPSQNGYRVKPMTPSLGEFPFCP